MSPLSTGVDWCPKVDREVRLLSSLFAILFSVPLYPNVPHIVWCELVFKGAALGTAPVSRVGGFFFSAPLVSNVSHSVWCHWCSKVQDAKCSCVT
jgi:hypothetical protein